MNKKEFIQQFIIHSAGPMLAIVNDRGEQRFSEADIKTIAENFADETCLGYTISDLYIEIIEEELNNCRESIKGALLEAPFVMNVNIFFSSLHGLHHDSKTQKQFFLLHLLLNNHKNQ